MAIVNSAVHEVGVMHRDLKPQNILIDEGLVAKIADFGVSSKKVGSDDRLDTIEGTPHFHAPEMFGKLTSGGYSGRKADIWALGVCFYCYCFFELPFFETDSERMKQAIVNEP